MANITADMLTRIRNGQQRKLISIEIPYSKFKESILKVIQKEGYIKSYTKKELPHNKSSLIVDLKYLRDGSPVIQEIRGVSKSGRRIYAAVADLVSCYNNLGVVILSTSKGVMSDSEARKANAGGEIICEIF